jgi:hypothetical protein
MQRRLRQFDSLHCVICGQIITKTHRCPAYVLSAVERAEKQVDRKYDPGCDLTDSQLAKEMGTYHDRLERGFLMLRGVWCP